MKNLKLLREERGLSQQKLADKFSISQQSVYKYENDLAEPDFSILKQLADFFHTSVDFLIDYVPENSSSDHIPITVTIENVREAHHIEMYRQLSTKSQKALDGFLESLIEKS